MIIADYLNRTGEHCGSSAMRNLLTWYCDLELSEAFIFGVGSGIDCILIEGLEEAPLLFFGRGATMEQDCTSALGIGYSEQPEPDNQKAWQVVRQQVLEGHPTMLSGDPLYLDYHACSDNFPSHRFVLVGLDDERQIAYIADRDRVEPYECTYRSLATARNPPDYPISAFNLWGRFDDPLVQHSMAEACRRGLAVSVARMLGRDSSQSDLIRLAAGSRTVSIATGLAGLARLAELMPQLANAPDPQRIAKLLAYTFEKYGTGGGNFRNFFASFLGEARPLLPRVVDEAILRLARLSAHSWHGLSGTLLTYHEEQADSAEFWRRCGAVLGDILTTEQALFETLDRKLSTPPRAPVE